MEPAHTLWVLQYCISHAILYFPRPLGEKKVEKLNLKEFFLNKRDALQEPGKRNGERFFCNYEKNFPKTATR